MKTTIALVLAGVLLAGCANKPPETAEREEIVTRTAIVQSVDLENREIVMRTDDDRVVYLVAGPEVRNLEQLAPGDRIWVDYRRSVAVRMADPNDPGRAVGVVVTEQAAEGDTPGGGVGKVVSMVVEFVSYDPKTSTVVFFGPDGLARSTRVRPEMRAFAATRKPGDRIEVTINTAVAVMVQKRQG